MSLSRHHHDTQSIQLMGLPPELLHIVFNHLQEDAVKSRDRVVDWTRCWGASISEHRATVRNARLVCRLFCALASPLMFTVLRLRVSRASLTLAKDISWAPRIAAGVRGVIISLEAWSKYEADEFLQCTQPNLFDLRTTRGGPETRPGLTAGQREAVLESLSRRLAAEPRERADAVEAGGQASGGGGGGGVVGESQTAPLQALRKEYHEYCRLHAEQQHLLSDGSFVRGLGSSVARMGGVASFRFVNKLSTKKRPVADPYGPMAQLCGAEMLSQYLSEPLGWSELGDGLRITAGSMCERLLWELPIALYQAGAPPRELALGVTPHSWYFPMLGDRGASDEPGRTTWDRLSAACQNLETLEFGVRAPEDWFRHPRHDIPNLSNYLSAVLSRCGQHLRLLDLNFSHPHHHVRPRTDRWFCDVGGVIVAPQQELSCLQTLKLDCMNLGQAELEALCSKIGNRLSHLNISSTSLRGESWAAAFDLLRQKIAMAPVTERHVHLENFLGGEFSSAESSMAELVVETMEYVQGRREANPLRGLSNI